MKNYGLIILGMGMIVLMIILSLGTNLDSLNEGMHQKRRTSFNRSVGESFEISRAGYYGIRFVECGKIEIKKRKLGALTLGAFNILHLTDLKVVLPPSALYLRETSTNATLQAKGMTAHEVIERLGLSKDILNRQHAGMRFSGLEIDFAGVCPRLGLSPFSNLSKFVNCRNEATI